MYKTAMEGLAIVKVSVNGERRSLISCPSHIARKDTESAVRLCVDEVYASFACNVTGPACAAADCRLGASPLGDVGRAAIAGGMSLARDTARSRIWCCSCLKWSSIDRSRVCSLDDIMASIFGWESGSSLATGETDRELLSLEVLLRLVMMPVASLRFELCLSTDVSDRTGVGAWPSIPNGSGGRVSFKARGGGEGGGGGGVNASVGACAEGRADARFDSRLRRWPVEVRVGEPPWEVCLES
mmetsp:Transcript_34751/g.66352  ORF Transcript_34751/g.66352 Transcript_34751/m.66352 type:complete len:242 (-) Transcript_34751:3860-4585(-)